MGNNLHLVVGENHEILRGVSSPIFDFNANLKQLATDMVNFMYTNDGIGLAAPQVGINKRLCVVDVCQGNNDVAEEVKFTFDGNSLLRLSDIQPLILINPVIEEISVGTEILWEGCVSLPGVAGTVKRAKEIVVSFFDVYGKMHRLKSDGILARCIQHETDHLDGILFIDRATNIERYTRRPKK